MPVFEVNLAQRVWYSAVLRVKADTLEAAQAKLSNLDLFNEAEKRGRWGTDDEDKIKVISVETCDDSAEHDIFI